MFERQVVIPSLEIKSNSKINVERKEKPGQKVCGFRCLSKQDEKGSYVTHQLRNIFPSVYTNTLMWMHTL